MKAKAGAFALILSMVAVSSAFAGGDDAKRLLDEAQALFDQRMDQSTIGKLQDALERLGRAEALATDAEVKYDILVLSSKTHYFLGNFQTTDDARMKVYEAGSEAAKRAEALDRDELGDLYADAYYYHSINLGKWALAKGVLASLQKKKELMEAAENAMTRQGRAGDAGEELDGYGPHRTLGRMYFKLPGFAGGSREKALKHLELAVEKAPRQALNLVYLAEVLYDGNAQEKARAKAMLDGMLKMTPEEFNSSRLPETRLEMEEGRSARRGMGN